MALSIKNQEIIGEISFLEEKLVGKLPVDRLELLYLINSWGRIDFFYTQYLDEGVKIENCRSKECYDLSKLDVSKITSMENLFKYSLFDGDISKWDVSNVTSMKEMFFSVESFNQPIGNWDVSNVTNMESMFEYAIKFNQNISSWNTKNVTTMYFMFNNAEAFLDKYNNSEPLPNKTDLIINWFNINRDKMNMIDVKDKHGVELDNFFSNFSNNYLLTKCNKQSSNRM